MPPIQFKFSRPPDGLVRRVSFPEKPSWDQLAAKIESMYNIPAESVGVSYIDNDRDEVTLSSEDELQDFYQSTTLERDGGTLTLVKLNVRDLDTFRNDKPLPETPRTGTASGMNYRNTFGRSAPVVFEMEVENGWQRIPSGLEGIFAGAQPHAFVEVLDSDADVSQFNNKDKDMDIDHDSSTNGSINTLPEIQHTFSTSKGKGRAHSEDFRSQSPDTISSTQSVVAAENGPKHPIHVLDMQNASTDSLLRRGSRSRSISALGPHTPTPKARTADPVPEESRADAQHQDPPLPDLDSMDASRANIANDVATLFGTLSTILASHPELSEGIRNIVRNASNGTYWETHREQVARAAEEIRRSAIMSADELRHVATDTRRTAEEAAGRRVADAIGNVIRVIADITGAQTAVDPHAQAPTEPAFEPTTSTPLRDRRHGGNFGAWDDPWTRFGGPYGRSRHGYRGPPSWGSFGSRWGEQGGPFSGPADFGHFPPPPGPPPPPHGRPGRPPGPPPPPVPPPVPPPPPGLHGHFGGPHNPGPFPPGDSPAGPPHARFGPPFFPPHMHHHHRPGEWDSEDPFGPPRGPHFGGSQRRYRSDNWADTVPAVPPRPDTSGEEAEITMYGASPLESPDAAKKALQAAKDAYVAEKEKYRRLREDRKKRKMNVSTDSETKDVFESPVSPRTAQGPATASVAAEVPLPPSVAAPQTSATTEGPQVISNARGSFPRLELYSVPRRSNTMHGTGHHRDASWGTFGSGGVHSTLAGRAAAVESIVRRLGDMGFTSAQYPMLAAKVDAHIPHDGEFSKEHEDSIVSEIVEELLVSPRTPAPPQASGSGSRRT